NQSGTVTSRVISSGSTSVKTVPSVVSPSLVAAGLETCLGSASSSVSVLGMGLGGGSTYVDEGCQARLDSRTQWAMGLRGAGVRLVCQEVKVWNSMPDVCAQYWPRGMPVPYGVAYAEPAGYGLPVRAMMSAESNGSIRVVDGRDGVEKDCLNYSATRQKCFQWAGEKPRKQRVANITTPQRIVVKPKSKP